MDCWVALHSSSPQREKVTCGSQSYDSRVSVVLVGASESQGAIVDRSPMWSSGKRLRLSSAHPALHRTLARLDRSFRPESRACQELCVSDVNSPLAHRVLTPLTCRNAVSRVRTSLDMTARRQHGCGGGAGPAGIGTACRALRTGECGVHAVEPRVGRSLRSTSTTTACGGIIMEP